MRQWESWLKAQDGDLAGDPAGARVLIIAAPSSGAGKTSITAGLLRAYRRRGLRVRAAKIGPDYIDPRFHDAASGADELTTSSTNLDSWAMTPEFLGATLTGLAKGADLLLIEAAVGLFDGLDAAPGRGGSAADLARRFGIPVLLLLNIAGQGRSAAAVAKGFAEYDPEVRVAAVALNRVGSARHGSEVAAEIARLGIPLAGTLYRDPEIGLPERHLGLVQALELDGLEPRLERLGELIAAGFDLDLIYRLAVPLTPIESGAAIIDPPGQRIALALDEAFGFVYPHLLQGWRAAGAEILPFSPLADVAPPDEADICWLPGGYPELHPGKLAAAENFLGGLRRFAATRPVHGECGGYMVLGQAIEDAQGDVHAMAGLLSHVTSFATRRLHLGYREALLLADCPLGARGTILRGHEFHYSTLVQTRDDAPLLSLQDGNGADLGLGGGRRGHVTGSYFHMILRV